MSILCCYFENTLSISASTCTYSSPLLHNPRLPSVNRRTVATLLASGSQYWLSQNSQCSLVHDPWRMRTGSCSHTPLVHLLLSCPKLYLPYCLRSGGASSACSSAAAAVWSPPKDTGTPPHNNPSAFAGRTPSVSSRWMIHSCCARWASAD